DAASDIGFGFGGKAAFEVEKNLFFGVAADWTNHDVDDPGEVAGANQLDQIADYDRVNFLFTVDYDIPLWKDDRAPIFRFGAATGLNWAKFSEREESINRFESFFSWVFRPVVGLRVPISDNFLLFTELSYDFVPERSLETTETAAVRGQRPIFSAGGIWVGVAFQFD
ncbi:MAG: hypothetical protein AAF517_05375, partial [Planctomycetota bacterium]